MHWAQVKDAYDKGFFHLPHPHKNQQVTSLQEEFNITPCLKSPVENSEETYLTRIIRPWPYVSDKHRTKSRCQLGNLHILKWEVKHSLRNRAASLYHPSSLCLLGIAGHLSRIT